MDTVEQVGLSMLWTRDYQSIGSLLVTKMVRLSTFEEDPIISAGELARTRLQA